ASSAWSWSKAGGGATDQASPLAVGTEYRVGSGSPGRPQAAGPWVRDAEGSPRQARTAARGRGWPPGAARPGSPGASGAGSPRRPAQPRLLRLSARGFAPSYAGASLATLGLRPGAGSVRMELQAVGAAIR